MKSIVCKTKNKPGFTKVWQCSTRCLNYDRWWFEKTESCRCRLNYRIWTCIFILLFLRKTATFRCLRPTGLHHDDQMMRCPSKQQSKWFVVFLFCSLWNHKMEKFSFEKDWIKFIACSISIRFSFSSHLQQSN